jgi:hypothetical protein
MRHRTFTAVFATAAVLSLLGLTALPSQEDAAAAGQQDGNPEQELARLREEHQTMRNYFDRQVTQLSEQADRFNLPTREQMQTLINAAIQFAQTRDNALPTRSSDLREIIGAENWAQLIAYYDRTPELIERLSTMDDPWQWIDEHGSFEWRGGRQDFDASHIVLVERRSALGETRWVFFGDGHGECVTDGGVFAAQLQKAGVKIVD